MKIFITGVSSGIGREAVKLLIKDGHEVWGVARREDLLKSLSSKFGSNLFNYSVCDVAESSEVDQVTNEMRTKGFSPDIVVLNSAIFPKDLDKEFNFSAFESVIRVNLGGALIWVEKFLPEFKKRGSGKFIAVSSTSAFRPDVNSVSLPSSKAGLSMAFRSLRLAYKASGLKFTTIYFAPVATDLVPEFQKKNSPFVLKEEKAGELMVKAILGKKEKYFFPLWLTLLFRLSLIFPDSWFSLLSKKIKS